MKLTGNTYTNIGADTLKILNKATESDSKIDAREINGIEIAAKSDGHFSEGEKALVRDLRSLVKDKNGVGDFKLSNFDPKGKVNFELKVGNNNAASVKPVHQSPKVSLPKSFQVGSLRFDLSKSTDLSNEVTYSEFKVSPANNSKTIRALTFDPKRVEFQAHHYEDSVKSFSSLPGQNKFIAATNGITFAGVPQGDIKGVDSKGKVSVYQLEKNQTAANLRYSIGVNKDGTVEVTRGGLNGKEARSHPKNPADYKYFINGASLLFDNQNYSDEKTFLASFKQRHDGSLVKNMRVETSLPRTAMGITADGKVILATFGEGKDRRAGNSPGATGFQVYQALKAMGAVKAVMLDGGGAPCMVTKDSKGSVNISSAYKVGNDDYTRNASFMVIKSK